MEGGRVVIVVVADVSVERPGEEVLEGDGGWAACVEGRGGGARAMARVVEEGGAVDLLPDLFHGRPNYPWVA